MRNQALAIFVDHQESRIGDLCADYKENRALPIISDGIERYRPFSDYLESSFSNHREPCISDRLAINSDQCRPLSGKRIATA